MRACGLIRTCSTIFIHPINPIPLVRQDFDAVYCLPSQVIMTIPPRAQTRAYVQHTWLAGNTTKYGYDDMMTAI